MTTMACIAVERENSWLTTKEEMKLDDAGWRLAGSCMTSRHTRSNAQGPLFTLSNEELARLERQNRQQHRPTKITMDDLGGQNDLTAALALMQQHMQQMQQTINAQEAARETATELATQQVDQLLKGNQSQVFIMEEETASENNVSDATPEGDNTIDDQQEVSYVNGQGWQYKNYHPIPNVRNIPHLFAYPKNDKPVDNAQNSQGQNSGYQKPYQGRTYVLSQAQHNQFQNQKQQTAQQTAPSPAIAPQDEMKGLATIMQQLLQGQQIHGKAQPYASDGRADRADSRESQEAASPQEVVSGGKLKEGEQPRSEAPPLSDEEPEQSAETDPTPVATPVEPVPSREYTHKVPYPVPAKTSRKDR
ncbi:hypothetical protein DY000_02053624 [Brassica cretica]|uniref:Uncharacterized protein n=1 Tax=Brassica cretica TaxID=69181 RepID=A0ABQ7A9K3_BRACR|nr:hypothetical protein DY000_02053624 [Brassica cretica]